MVSLAAASLARAATVWDGPTIDFSHSDENGLADQMTPGVAITRSSSGGGLYNAMTEGGTTSGISPADTAWAIGSLADYNTLTYGPCPLESGNRPPNYVGTTFVVHLISEDIYLSLTLTDWGAVGGFGDHTFSYTRATAAAGPPPTPTVTITNPTGGAVFAAPANVNIGADASVSGGTVDSVQFFANGVSAGSVLTSPFHLTANNLAAGAYALTAVATAAGISATSAVVNITVVPAPTVSITNPASGAVFVAPANVNIAASATVTGGTVTNVQFFTNGVSAGSVLTAPFTLTAGNLAAGAYALNAVATAAGISTTSTVVNITVVGTPTVTITNPPGGAVFAAPANVNIAASAAVTGGTVTNVQFFTNGVSAGSVLTAPFTLTAGNLAAGAYALTAVATAAGISATSSVVNITVVSAPTVNITNPVSGAVFVAPANVDIASSATVSGGTVTNVQFFTNGVSAGSVLTAPFTLTAGNLAAGAYALTAMATAAGISATSSVVNITVDAPPNVTITNPLNNATLSAPANVTIRASASDTDGSVTNVQFIVGTNILTNVNNAPFSGTTNNLGAGSYMLSAIASDNNGVKNTNVISITVVTPMAVSLAGPTPSSSTNFQFTFSANVGLSYVIQRSTSLAAADWIPLVTNTAASNPVVFVDVHATNSPNFYRVGRLPNP